MGSTLYDPYRGCEDETTENIEIESVIRASRKTSDQLLCDLHNDVNLSLVVGHKKGESSSYPQLKCKNIKTLKRHF